MNDQTPNPPTGPEPDESGSDTPDPRITDALQSSPPPPEHGPQFWAQLDHQLAAEPTGATVFDGGETADDPRLAPVVPLTPPPAPAAPPAPPLTGEAYPVAPVIEYAAPDVPDAPSRRNGVIMALLGAAAVLVLGIVVGSNLLGGDDDTIANSTTSQAPETTATPTTTPTSTTAAPTVASTPTTVTTPSSTTEAPPTTIVTDATWTVLGPTIDGGGEYVAINQPTDPDNTETGSVQLGVVRDGEITRTYPITSCGLRLAEGPQTALTVTANCEESFAGMWVGSQLGAEVRAFTPLTLTPAIQTIVGDVVWNLTAKVMEARAVVPEFGTEPVAITITDSGVVSEIDTAPTELTGTRVVADVMQYDFLVPDGWGPAAVDAGGANISGPSFDQSLSITTRYLDDTLFGGNDDPTTGLGSDATIVSDRTEDVPLWTAAGELSGTTAPVRQIEATNAFGNDLVVWVYTLTDRKIGIWTTLTPGSIDDNIYAALAEQVRVYETNGSVAAPTTCSATDLPDPGPQDGLSEAAQAKRAAIIAAALACDIPALAALTSDDFTASFGGSSAEELWADGERYGGSPLETLVRHLSVPFAVADDGSFIWPQAHNELWADVTDEMRDDLRDLGYTDEDFGFFAEVEGYWGFRIGITEAGDWEYFVAGD